MNIKLNQLSAKKSSSTILNDLRHLYHTLKYILMRLSSGIKVSKYFISISSRNKYDKPKK